MAKKIPAIMFYTGDWLKDPLLGMCSPATRGIWIDLLCLMHENGRSGKLTGTVESLSRICRCSADEMQKALDELSVTKTADVTICHNDVTVMSRRMVREAKDRNNNRLRKKRQRCHGDVTEKSRSLSSYSYSISNSNIFLEDNNTAENESKENDKPVVKNKYFSIPQNKYDAFRDAYPHVDILSECKKMVAWLDANPERQKKNYMRFVNNWLSKANEIASEKAKNTRQEINGGW